MELNHNSHPGIGPFRGKGPRNYTRSDSRIREDICDRMSDNRYLDATNVEVFVENGVVELRGEVEGRYAIYVAQMISETAYGVKEVNNFLGTSAQR